MQEVLIVGIVFLSVVSIVKIIADTKTRNQLLEKGAVDEKTRQALVGYSELSVLNNLKWGMVLIGIGAAGLLSHLMPYYWSDEGAVGLIFLFAGIGFLVYYPIAQKRLKEIEQRKAQH